MGTPDIDPNDAAEYIAFMDARGRNPRDYQVVASPGSSPERELEPSSRTVSVTHMPTQTTRSYNFRTWMSDFKHDVDAGVFDHQT